MKRKAQIILIVVSLILTAILITTCIFSGTFAKYATSGSDTVTARVQKFGVTAEVTTSKKFEDTKKPMTIPNLGQIEVTLDGTEMYPGADMTDAIKMQLYGEAETRVMVVIDFDIAFEESTFTYPQNSGNEPLTLNRLYFPVKYTAGKSPANSTMETTTVTDARTVTVPTNANAVIDFNFSQAYASYMGMSFITSPFRNGNYAVAKIFEPGEKITLAGYEPSMDNVFQLGFNWPLENTAEINTIETWLAQNNNLKATVKFNIKIEQIKDDFSFPVPNLPTQG